MAEIFSFLSRHNVIHADLKPDNILVKMQGTELKDLKLIDFGSAFYYHIPGSVSMSTPEYLAPEVLEYL